MEAQNAIRNANILLITVKAVGNEIAKNLVLAGIASITISDLSPVVPEDLSAQFFLRPEDVGKTRAEAALPNIQQLNSRVRTSILAADPLTAGEDTTYLRPFDIVIATDLPIASLNAINTHCRLEKKRFYCAGSHGLYGYMFADLISHTFSIEREPSNVPVKEGTAETPTRSIVSVMRIEDGGPKKELITKREMYQPLVLANTAPLPEAIKASPRRMKAVPPLLPCLRGLWDFETANNGAGPDVNSQNDIALFTQLATESSRQLQLPLELLKADFLRSFLSNAYLEIAPTSSFIGSALAQDVINVLGGREQPCQNTVLFDGEAGRAECYAFVPEIGMPD